MTLPESIHVLSREQVLEVKTNGIIQSIDARNKTLQLSCHRINLAHRRFIFVDPSSVLLLQAIQYTTTHPGN